ncbi:MAG: hypothetical protein ABI216_22165 [Devosia sp.]
MATYAELLVANADTGLINRVRVATFISATDIITEAPATTNHTNRLLWAKQVFSDPAAMGSRMMWPVLAQNRALTLSQLTGASDADVQGAVDAAVNVFASGV